MIQTLTLVTLTLTLVRTCIHSTLLFLHFQYSIQKITQDIQYVIIK
jgi:hypothetical protein